MSKTDPRKCIYCKCKLNGKNVMEVNIHRYDRVIIKSIFGNPVKEGLFSPMEQYFHGIPPKQIRICGGNRCIARAIDAKKYFHWRIKNTNTCLDVIKESNNNKN